ncbi:MAG: ABC transporter permease [Candidatus Omnitrophica bacterium]|nr:ABC transporter permease [Candidatus Omnitrophota bacterium]
MMDSLSRINAMFFRYACLHKRSLPRTLEIVFWPVMELLVWGFVTLYLQRLSDSVVFQAVVFLINAMIFWDILYRSQQGVSISFVEDIWTQNIVNLLISPLRISEWIIATFLYGLTKIIVITSVLSGIAFTFYQFNLIEKLGLYLIPLMANLLLFGWALGIVTAGLVIRWGHAVEALIWGIPFLIQPFSAIFYPLSTLPPALQLISKLLPSTYVFEGMRFVIQNRRLPLEYFLIALGLNTVYFVLAGLFFNQMYHGARASGRLGKLGMD